MDNLEPIALPVAQPMWLVACIQMYRGELHARLGMPHSVDPEGNGLGIEHLWAFALKPMGQRLLVQLCLPHGDGVSREYIIGETFLYADPPDVVPVLSALGIEQSDSRVIVFPPTTVPPGCL